MMQWMIFSYFWGLSWSWLKNANMQWLALAGQIRHHCTVMRLQYLLLQTFDKNRQDIWKMFWKFRVCVKYTCCQLCHKVPYFSQIGSTYGSFKGFRPFFGQKTYIFNFMFKIDFFDRQLSKNYNPSVNYQS